MQTKELFIGRHFGIRCISIVVSPLFCDTRNKYKKLVFPCVNNTGNVGPTFFQFGLLYDIHDFSIDVDYVMTFFNKIVLIFLFVFG